MRALALALLATAALGALSASDEGECPEQPLTFLSIGDWGMPGFALSSIGAGMRQLAEQEPVSFVLGLGDNDYTQPGRRGWERSYRQAFEPLDVPFLTVLGNHDHEVPGDPEAQIAFGSEHALWHLPDYNYTATFAVEGGVEAQFFFIDTCIAVPGGLCPRSTPRGRSGGKQWRWLERELARSSARWKFVVGHYPVLSAGAHGDSARLRERLQPMLERHNVTAYFAGHDHNVQHLEANGMHYFVSGAGSHSSRVRHRRRGDLRFGDHRPAFGVHRLSADEFTTEFVDVAGRVLYWTSVRVADGPLDGPSDDPSDGRSLGGQVEEEPQERGWRAWLAPSW